MTKQSKASPSPEPLIDSDNEVDVALMMRVKAGEHAAFEALILRHQGAVIGTVAKMLGSTTDSEDIAQQVFIRLWKAAPNYEVKAKFTTFLYTITRNLVFNESRRKSRHKTFSIEEQEDENHLLIAADDSISPDKEVLQSELQHTIDQAIQSLPEKQRIAVILRRYEKLPYEEIASILELSVSAVKSQLFRARASLRENLSLYLNDSNQHNK